MQNMPCLCLVKIPISSSDCLSTGLNQSRESSKLHKGHGRGTYAPRRLIKIQQNCCQINSNISEQ